MIKTEKARCGQRHRAVDVHSELVQRRAVACSQRRESTVGSREQAWKRQVGQTLEGQECWAESHGHNQCCCC